MKASQDRRLFFPSRLKNEMKSILSAPLTLVTAGSGFGKTTAVSSFVETLSEEQVCRWYTCFGEPPERAWAGICELLAIADPNTAGFLTKISAPTLDSLGHIALLMGGFHCERETILVIDNYQMAGFPEPYRLLDTLAAHRCTNLHFVVLTHPIHMGAAQSGSNPHIHQIEQTLFCFHGSEIQTLFSRLGANICSQDADLLDTETEGWVAALRLYLSHFLSGGALNENVGINELMERVFWRPLREEQREFFLGLSLLDTFTEAQAACMLGQDKVSAALWETVRNNPFVRRTGEEYTLHSLLKEYLSTKMLVQTDAFHKTMWRRAGSACAVRGKNIEAFLFFSACGEDATAYGIPLTSFQEVELVRNKSTELETLLTRIPDAPLLLHPEPLLSYAIKAVLQGKGTLARTTVIRLKGLSAHPGLEDKARRYVSAALELIASFQAYNDAAEMSRHHKAAWEQIGGTYLLHETSEPWTSCAPSVAFMFWRESGNLKEACRILTEDVHYYVGLSGGNGAGSPETMQAELLLLAGDDQQAELKAHRALYIAGKHGQDSLCFCAELTLCRLALLRGKVTEFRAALEAIRLRAFTGAESRCVTSAEVCLGFAYRLLDMDDQIPGWMENLPSIQQYLYHVSVPFAQIIFARLLLKKDPIRFIAISDELIREADQQHSLLPKLYYWLEQAVYYEQTGFRAKARERVGQALSHALPDEVYLPIAEYYAQLSEVLEDPALPCADKAGLERVCSLGRRFVSGVAAVRAALLDTSPLTPREREIALLAKQRLSTQEIAQQLTISVATVRNTLSKVYDKLNIRGKAELANRQF